MKIEQWHYSDATEALATNSKLLQVLHWFQDEAPLLNTGYYAMAPGRDYWRAIHGPGIPEYQAWQNANDLRRPLALDVDTLYPSI